MSGHWTTSVHIHPPGCQAFPRPGFISRKVHLADSGAERGKKECVGKSSWCVLDHMRGALKTSISFVFTTLWDRWYQPPFCEKKKKKRGSERLSNMPKVTQHWHLFQVYLAPESELSFIQLTYCLKVGSQPSGVVLREWLRWYLLFSKIPASQK